MSFPFHISLPTFFDSGSPYECFFASRFLLPVLIFDVYVHFYFTAWFCFSVSLCAFRSNQEFHVSLLISQFPFCCPLQTMRCILSVSVQISLCIFLSSHSLVSFLHLMRNFIYSYQHPTMVFQDCNFFFCSCVNFLLHLNKHIFAISLAFE